MYYPKHKIIFIAINKTGSTSVLQALNDSFYEQDVPEIWQLNNQPGTGRVHEYLKHAQAYFYYHVLGAEEFNKCYSFSLIRNPWDKLVSDFFFRCRSPKQPEEWRMKRKWFVNKGLLEPTSSPDNDLFRLFVRAMKDHDLIPHGHWKSITRKFDLPDKGKENVNQLDGLTDLDNKLMINNVVKLEEISLRWKSIQHIFKDRTGIDLDNLQHTNQSKRDKYQQYYDAETYEIVNSLFRRDIAYFNYKF